MRDEKGEEMHKSTGNAIWFDEAVEKMGADVMRWLYCAFNPSFNLRFGFHVADDVRRKLLTLWNVYGFFVTYAAIDRFDPRLAEIEETLGRSPNPLDRWILSAQHGLIGEFRAKLDDYDPAGALRAAEEFFDALSTWYVRRSRRRFWRSDHDGDKLFAYRTLHYVLTTTCRLLAPVIPFLTEEMWRNLTEPLREGGTPALAPGSVHLTSYPEARPDLVDAALNARMDAVLRAVSLGRAAREKIQIRTRQPLRCVWLVPLSGALPDLGEDLLREVAEELNVKEVRTDRTAPEVGEASVRLNFPLLGKRLGPAVKEVQAAVKSGNWTVGPDGSLDVAGHGIAAAEYELVYQPRSGLALAHDHGLLVALDTTITDDLLLEGYAREAVRAIQEMRKRAGYQVEDRITLHWQGDDSAIALLLDRHGPLIGEETLATRILAGRVAVDQETEIELGQGRSLWLGIRR
jgi:isoleucyl-tRNA synthetase